MPDCIVLNCKCICVDAAVQGNKVEGRRRSFLGVFGLTPRKNSSAIPGAH